jgi:hypothetical protein
LRRLTIFIISAIIICSFFINSISVKADSEICLSEVSGGIVCDNHNAYDGYWWRGYWIPGMLSQASRMTPIPTLTKGMAVMYNPGVMEASAEARGLYTPGNSTSGGKYSVNGIGGYIGGVATETCSEIGTSVWLKREGYNWEGPYLVVDCAQRNDAYGQIVNWDLNVEIDFDTALRWQMVTSNVSKTSWSVKQWHTDNVLVSKINPACLGNIKIVDLSEWFKDIAVFAQPHDERALVYYKPSTWLLDGKRITFYQEQCYLLPKFDTRRR